MRPDQRLGVADIEPAPGLHLLREALHQVRLGGGVEIDHDVAAEDGVEQAVKGPRLHQVEPVEDDERTHVVVHRHAGAGVVGVFEEFLIGLRDIVDRARWILAARRLGQHVGIDVGGEDAHVVARDIPDLALEHHRDRIGLLAGRAAGRPDSQTPVARAIARLHERHRDVGAEVIEVVRLAEELGVIGGDRVDEALDLPFALREVFPIFLERVQPERAQAARQAAVDQVALAVGERNAGVLVGELRQAAKVRLREGELPAQVAFVGGQRRRGAALTRRHPRTPSTPDRPAPPRMPSCGRWRRARPRPSPPDAAPAASAVART